MAVSFSVKRSWSGPALVVLKCEGTGSVKPFNDEILRNQEAADCLQPMGQTSENVGSDFNISRGEMDKYANESFRRAEIAQKAGWFDDEIVPITTQVKDPKSGEAREVTLSKDEGPRYGTTVESLGKIRPAFPQFGNATTGGNASQVTDGGTIFRKAYPFFDTKNDSG